jgi:hypothetical protein
VPAHPAWWPGHRPRSSHARCHPLRRCSTPEPQAVGDIQTEEAEVGIVAVDKALVGAAVIELDLGGGVGNIVNGGGVRLLLQEAGVPNNGNDAHDNEQHGNNGENGVVALLFLAFLFFADRLCVYPIGSGTLLFAGSLFFRCAHV